MSWQPQTAMECARAHLKHWEEQHAYTTDSHRSEQCEGFIRQCNIVIRALEHEKLKRRR